MKILKKLSFVLVALLVLYSCGTLSVSEQHVGQWEGKDKGDIGFLNLTTDGYATFRFNGQTTGGKSYDHQGVKAAMKYIVNNETSPASIDFIIIDLTSNTELGRLKGIIKMKSRNEMQMAITFGGGSGRPANFEKDAIIFDRVK